MNWTNQPDERNWTPAKNDTFGFWPILYLLVPDYHMELNPQSLFYFLLSSGAMDLGKCSTTHSVRCHQTVDHCGHRPTMNRQLIGRSISVQWPPAFRYNLQWFRCSFKTFNLLRSADTQNEEVWKHERYFGYFLYSSRLILIRDRYFRYYGLWKIDPIQLEPALVSFYGQIMVTRRCKTMPLNWYKQMSVELDIEQHRRRQSDIQFEY